MDARVWLLLVVCACVRASVLSAKGYYCKDPDTGKLYSVNTTWPSTTFCGNYTCKIRIKQHDMDLAPSRIIINITNPEPRTDANMDPKVAGSSNIFVKVKQDEKENINIPNIPMNHNSDEDRFLTSEEIKTISQMLHTVKKSDLDAIIEIYNLAQEIYNEMDEDTTNAALKESLETPIGKTPHEHKFPLVKNYHTSYWYEPDNDFRKLIALKAIHPDPSGDKKSDMKSAASDYVAVSARPYQPHAYTQVPQVAYPNTQPAYYTTAPVLNNQDTNRLAAYYYPLSHFQRIAPYYHQLPHYDTPQPVYSACKTCHGHNYPSARYGEIKPYPTPQKQTLPSMLPFPLKYKSYNETGYAYNYNYNNFYKGNPWAYYDYYRSNPYPFIPKEQPQAKAIPTKPREITPIQNEEQKPVENNENIPNIEKDKDDEKSWKTDPLSEAVLAEVRANIAERAKLLKIPLKKRIKLDRVAKVIKLDLLNRQKREAFNVEQQNIPKPTTESKEEFEVYLEKTICESSTEPGYFRVGNMSQPYPACCPQKIERP